MSHMTRDVCIYSCSAQLQPGKGHLCARDDLCKKSKAGPEFGSGRIDSNAAWSAKVL